jgi:N utilization substance protein B
VSDTGTRHAARERALGLLYEAEMRDQTPAEVVAGLPVPPDEYAEAVVLGVGDHLAEIDALLARYSKRWDLDRMPSLDRAVLRMATFELGHRLDVPRNVILNEAVELAKTFSTDDSGRFVNGMLSAVADEVRPPS